MTFDGPIYLEAGSQFYMRLFASGLAANMKSSYSMLALPSDMPLSSFEAYQNSQYYLSPNNPTRIGNWYATPNTNHKGGVHALDATFDTANGIFTVKYAGVYLCMSRVMTYSFSGPSNLEVELRVNDERNPNSIGYGRQGVPSGVGSTHWYYNHVVLLKLNQNDKVSVWATSTSVYFVSLAGGWESKCRYWLTLCVTFLPCCTVFLRHLLSLWLHAAWHSLTRFQARACTCGRRDARFDLQGLET